MLANLAAGLLKRNGLTGLVVALLAAIAAATAAADEVFPSRPVTMMVGFPPGGPTDTLARIIADAMQRPLGQPVVVETLSGSSGTIATGRVVHARPDGYTLGIGNWSSHVASPSIYPLDYDIMRDLQPISLLSASPLWILGKEALPPNTLPELIAWLKARAEPASSAPSVPAAPPICVDCISRKRPDCACNTCRIAAVDRSCRI